MGYRSKEIQREYQRKWCAKNRASYLDGKKCVKCGSAGPLEVDHIDPALKVSHNVWSWSAERRSAELAKCQTLCNPCHLEKTLAQRPKPEHGTLSRYQSGKCRCIPCKAANAAKTARERAASRDRKMREAVERISG